MKTEYERMPGGQKQAGGSGEKMLFYKV